MDLLNSLNNRAIFPSGIFSLLEEVDAKTVFVPIAFAAELFETNQNISALEIKLLPGIKENYIRKTLEKDLGSRFYVRNKYQQHESLYRTMNSEKWITYLILSFILLIATFNILGSLSMLIIDKKDDIQILRSMGASSGLIRRIFLFEGWLISITGCLTGLVAGIIVCWLQIHFQWITLPGEGSFVISAYPVDLQYSDLILIVLLVLTIGFLAAWYPVRFITRSGNYYGDFNA
jgi:lipoprotein-releasing system permease protein